MQLLDIIYIVLGERGSAKMPLLGFSLTNGKIMFELEVCLSKSNVLVSFHAVGTLWPSSQQQQYFKESFSLDNNFW